MNAPKNKRRISLDINFSDSLGYVSEWILGVLYSDVSFGVSSRSIFEGRPYFKALSGVPYKGVFEGPPKPILGAPSGAKGVSMSIQMIEV